MSTESDAEELLTVLRTIRRAVPFPDIASEWAGLPVPRTVAAARHLRRHGLVEIITTPGGDRDICLKQDAESCGDPPATDDFP